MATIRDILSAVDKVEIERLSELLRLVTEERDEARAELTELKERTELSQEQLAEKRDHRGNRR